MIEKSKFKKKIARYTAKTPTKIIFSQFPQIQSPPLPSQKQQIPVPQRVIQPTFVERKQPLVHRPRVQPSPWSKVKYMEVTKPNIFTSTEITNCHPPKQHKYFDRHFLSPPQRVTYYPQVSYPQSKEMVFPEGQYDKEIETNYPIKKKLFIKPAEELYEAIPELTQYIITSEMVHKFLPKQINVNKLMKCIGRTI